MTCCGSWRNPNRFDSPPVEVNAQESAAHQDPQPQAESYGLGPRPITCPPAGGSCAVPWAARVACACVYPSTKSWVAGNEIQVLASFSWIILATDGTPSAFKMKSM